MKVYIVITVLNEYNQNEPGYYNGVYSSKEVAIKSVPYIGRKKYEYSWYEILEADLDTNKYTNVSENGE